MSFIYDIFIKFLVLEIFMTFQLRKNEGINRPIKELVIGLNTNNPIKYKIVLLSGNKETKIYYAENWEAILESVKYALSDCTKDLHFVIFDTNNRNYLKLKQSEPDLISGENEIAIPFLISTHNGNLYDKGYCTSDSRVRGLSGKK